MADQEPPGGSKSMLSLTFNLGVPQENLWLACDNGRDGTNHKTECLSNIFLSREVMKLSKGNFSLGQDLTVFPGIDEHYLEPI